MFTESPVRAASRRVAAAKRHAEALLVSQFARQAAFAGLQELLGPTIVHALVHAFGDTVIL
jgi:hypothetical protein